MSLQLACMKYEVVIEFWSLCLYVRALHLHETTKFLIIGTYKYYYDLFHFAFLQIKNTY